LRPAQQPGRIPPPAERRRPPGRRGDGGGVPPEDGRLRPPLPRPERGGAAGGLPPRARRASRGPGRPPHGSGAVPHAPPAHPAGVSRIELVVFDLDGTLIDSAHDLAAAVNAALRRLAPAAEPVPLERVRTFIGDGASMLVARTLSAAGVALSA